MHLFVAGPGQDVVGLFDPAIRELTQAGYTAESGHHILLGGDPILPPIKCATPCEHCPTVNSSAPNAGDWPFSVVEDLRRCDGVATLDGWQCSPGAMLEVGFAAGAGLPHRPLQWWLDRAPDG
jgi:hypothetical protein